MKETVERLLIEALHTLKTSANMDLPPDITVKVERTKESSHGDFATNIALTLAKTAKIAPRQLAELIIKAIGSHPLIKKIELAGPGFINFFIHNDALLAVIPTIITQKDTFGHSTMGANKKIILEFVSSNPTGPLHVGHGRGAAIGASLANILKAAGFQVEREYYVNDAGRQMNILAVSMWLRYLDLTGYAVVFPANAYQGDYVKDIAANFLQIHGTNYSHSWDLINENLPLDEPQGGDKERYIDAVIARAKALLGDNGFKLFHQYTTHAVLTDIKQDLNDFGVEFDQWFSEQSLLDSGSIYQGIEALKRGHHTYLKEGALWFKATEFGDEKDRVLIRANGQPTYFASDVAYHWHKYERGFGQVINIFGADHHGYVTRVKAAVKALGHDEEALSVIFVQFAILYRGATRLPMSTRSGSFVTLRELRFEVGKDAARFFYVMRKPEQHLDFDLDLAKSQSSDNPVYYIQYAHARISSVFCQLAARNLNFDSAEAQDYAHHLTSAHEVKLLTVLNRYPEVIMNAARHYEPHQLAYYLRELATSVHSYYNAIQILCEDASLRQARLLLLMAISQVLKNGLQLLGVSAPESM